MVERNWKYCKINLLFQGFWKKNGEKFQQNILLYMVLEQDNFTLQTETAVSFH